MKTVINKASLLLRLGLTATCLLLGQQALAAGTLVDTPVLNRATVDYSVNSVVQTEIESSPSGNSTPGATFGTDTEFRVDRRVDFSITNQGALTAVNQGDVDQVVEFLLTNDSNSALDFALSALNTIGGDTGHGVDNVDVPAASIRWHVSAGVGAGGPDPVLGVDPVDVINLPPDESIRIWAYADIVGAFANGDIAALELFATAAEPSSAAATLLVEVAANTALGVENVWTSGPVAVGSNYTVSEFEGYVISTFPMTISKSSTVISDPVNGVSANAKAIPGAVIEYLITIDNSAASVDATGISITDIINAPALFGNAANQPSAAEPYDIGDGPANILFGPGGAPTGSCLADGDATDGCTFAGITLTIAGSDLAVLTPIDVAAGTLLEVRLQVVIPPVP